MASFSANCMVVNRSPAPYVEASEKDGVPSFCFWLADRFERLHSRHTVRGNDWVKKTCAQRETLTIAGFALDGKDRNGIYVGRRKGKNLVYASRASTRSRRRSCGGS